MREAYFTPTTIAKTANVFKQDLAPLLRKGEIGYDPKKSALLVLDMQRYFLEPSSHAHIPSAAAIIPGVQKLIRAYQTHQLAIIFTRHLNTRANAKRMSSWWRELISPENPLSQIAPELEVQDGGLLIKSQYDAFYETDLEDILRERHITQVVVCGVMTHLCCETTARAAFIRGFEVFFTIDGTATYNTAFHQASLQNLAHGFATPVLVSELLAHFGESDEG